MINVPRLFEERILEAVKDGKKVYETPVDTSLINLITKRFDPKKKYTSLAQRVFNDLNLLSGIPKHISSGKSKLIGGNITLYSNPEDLIKRLRLLTGTRRAGNTNFNIRNEVWQIIDELRKKEIISKSQYDSYVRRHLV